MHPFTGSYCESCSNKINLEKRGHTPLKKKKKNTENLKGDSRIKTVQPGDEKS